MAFAGEAVNVTKVLSGNRVRIVQLGKTAARHTSAEFVAFLADIVVNQPRGKEIHVIADNLSAHKTGLVEDFLDRHPKVHLHFTPTYSSWLNQIELWFAKIERDVIARGVFTSLADLRRKLMKYIRHYNKVPKTVKWSYFDPTRHITLDRARRHFAWRVHVAGRFAEKAHEVHPALQQGAKDRKVALLRSYASHHSQFSRYSPLVGTAKPLLPSGSPRQAESRKL